MRSCGSWSKKLRVGGFEVSVPTKTNIGRYVEIDVGVAMVWNIFFKKLWVLLDCGLGGPNTQTPTMVKTAGVNQQPPMHQLRMRLLKPFWGWTKTTSSLPNFLFLFSASTLPQNISLLPTYLPTTSYLLPTSPPPTSYLPPPTSHLPPISYLRSPLLEPKRERADHHR